MLVKEKKKHHEELIKELENVILEDKYIKLNESPYLIDYLYGYSDIDEEVNKFLDKMDLNEEWIVFYRCILKLKFLNGAYDKYKNLGKNIFLMRNKNDFEKWKKIIDVDENNEIDQKVNLVLKKLLDYIKEKKENKEIKEIDELFLCLETKNEFIKLLGKYLEKKEKKDELYEKYLYEIDTMLGKAFKLKKIIFNKTCFIYDILDINRAKMSSIQKKYEEGKK